MWTLEWSTSHISIFYSAFHKPVLNSSRIKKLLLVSLIEYVNMFTNWVWKSKYLIRFYPSVMTYPAESVQIGYQNHVEDIRSFLDSRHADHYTVFNLSQRNYRGAKFSNRVSVSHNVSWSHRWWSHDRFTSLYLAASGCCIFKPWLITTLQWDMRPCL